MISNLNFPNNAFETAAVWCIIDLTAILRYVTIVTKEKLHFSLICSFCCCLVKKCWALKFAYQGLVAYKK